MEEYKFISYPKTLTYDKLIKELDYLGIPLDRLKQVQFIVTEKVHGTNASVCLDLKSDKIYVQSKNKIIDIYDDNEGCANAVFKHIDTWRHILHKNVEAVYSAMAEKGFVNVGNLKTMVVSYEWAGGGIQYNSCLSDLSKKSMIFPISRAILADGSVMYLSSVDVSTYVNEEIYPISSLTEEVSYKGATLEFINNEVTELLRKNELSSPIGNYFGKENNFLEGYVVSGISPEYGLIQWKIKGDKYITTKVEKIKSTKPKDTKLTDLAHKLCPPWRLEQMYSPTIEREDFLLEVQQDICTEEKDVLEEECIQFSKIQGYVKGICIRWFNDRRKELELELGNNKEK